MTELDDFLVEFEELIINAPDEAFAEGSLMISNQKYDIHFIHDNTNNNPRGTLLDLIRSRPELLKATLRADNFNQTVNALGNLTEWMRHRDYLVGFSGNGFIRTARVFLFGLKQRILSYFVG